MALTDATKWTASDLRGMSHSQIEGLVEAGIVPSELAAEILTQDGEKQQEQFSAAQQSSQARVKEKEQDKKDGWLEHMSQSYQVAYHELMDTYDNAQKQYGTIKSDAEKLKTRLRGDMDTAYQSGIHLPDGKVAFFDHRRGAFVDASLQPLQTDDAKEAAAEFKQLPSAEQRKNAGYADACYAYAHTDGLAQKADAASVKIGQAEAALENSDGGISEQKLHELKNEAVVENKNLSDDLIKAKQSADNLDAVLSDDLGDDAKNSTENSTPASRSESVSKDTDSKITTSNTSFASLIYGGNNGKTSALFNAAAVAVQSADTPDNKFSPARAPAVPMP